ncbi:MAG: WXG100 family type VII secretion target [Trebonia sp.]
MAYSKPSSFEPLASSDPVPADTDAMTSLGKQYTNTAAMIEQQASDLKQLSSSASDAWKSKAGSVFVSKASGLSTRITQAEQRYSTAGSALTAAAGPMYDAQQQAYAAVAKAQEAQSQLTANAPGPKPAPGSPPPTAQEKADAQTKATNYSDAQGSLSQAQNQFNNAVSDYQSAASSAAKTINNELGHDPLKDSWFEQHFGWLVSFFKWIAVAIMILAVIALLIACPFTAAGLAAILGVSMSTLATVGTVIGWVTFGLTLAQTIFDGVAAHDGLESWQAFGLDILGLATFGLGKGAEAWGEGLTDAATDAGKDAASEAASEAAEKSFMDSDPRALHNAWVEANSDEAGPGAFLLNPSGVAAEAAEAASSAGKDAAATIEAAAKAAKAGNLGALSTMSGDLSKDLSTLNAINQAVPNVAKVGTIITQLKGLAAASGIVQWGSTINSAYFTAAAFTSG